MHDPMQGPQHQTQPAAHPWKYFAHPNHQAEDLHRLLRVLRATLTELHVFQSEAQMVGFYKQGLKNAPLRQLSSTFDWLLSNAEWREKVRQPSLIPWLLDPGARRLLQEFSRGVLCVRALRRELSFQLQSVPNGSPELSRLAKGIQEALQASSNLDTLPANRRELEQEISDAKSRLGEIESIVAFFASLAAQSGAPIPENCEQAIRLFAALDCIERIPPAVLPWREKHILDPAQRLKLQTWKVRARPILEARKELMAHFRFEAEVPIERLKAMADMFKDDGWLTHFKAGYRDVLRAYRELLRDKTAQKVDMKESDFQRSERLLAWVAFLEQTRAFEESEDAQSAFSPQFHGIDTDFASAIEAGVWSQKIREEIIKQENSPSEFGGTTDEDFNSRLLDFVRYIPQENVAPLVESAKTEGARHAFEFVWRSRGPVGSDFQETRGKAAIRRESLAMLSAALDAIGLQPEIALSSLSTIRDRLDEVNFLVCRIHSQIEAVEALRAVEMDLEAVEECSAYLKHVLAAELPEKLEQWLLSSRGPQSLGDAQAPVQRCALALSGLREHYTRLETATHGQIRVLSGGDSLETVSIERLIETIQDALRQPQLFVPLVTQLRQERGVTGTLPSEPGQIPSHGQGLTIDRPERDSASTTSGPVLR